MTFRLFLTLSPLLGCWVGACEKHQASTSKETLRVFLADSLARPLNEAKRAFEQVNPGVELVQIPSGSVVAIRKITEGGDQADILAVADISAIDQLMRPRHADWYIVFGGNEVVIAYTPASRGAAGLTPANWFQVLSRDAVRVAAANPYHDPCGYWTMLCWQLADRYYAGSAVRTESREAVGEGFRPQSGPYGLISERMARKCGAAHDRRSDSEELISLLESAGGIDYAFVYRSQALQHHLSFLRLPPEINLGDAAQRDRYRQVSITLPPQADGKEIRKTGEAILYAATIPKNARNPQLAVRYLSFLLSPKGRAILSVQYLRVTDAPWTGDWENLPDALRELVPVPPTSSRAASASEHALAEPTDAVRSRTGVSHGR